MAGPMPPPAKAPSNAARKRAAFEKLTRDTEALAQTAAEVAESVFYDRDSPAVRKRRESTRFDFELYCDVVLDLHESSAMWNSATIITRTKEYLRGSLLLAKGKLGKNPRADILWHSREAIYWWALRIIPDFASVYGKWHAGTAAFIHLIAHNAGLEKSHYTKNNLTDLELILMFQVVQSMDKGTENWKQHFAAWLLTYICGVRPGSFTVCPGYEKGAKLTETSVRPEDETLRWRHCEFIRIEGRGIAVRVEFEYNKGHRDPHSRKLVTGKRNFTFMPTIGDRYELDISLILLSLAYSRGLFHATSAEELFEGDDRYIKVKAAVANQPIFLAATQTDVLDPNAEAMKEKALNPKLQEMCLKVGLLARNTMYSFRRTAIVETKRQSGSELARELAAHVPEGRTLYAYDDQGLADLDVTAMRLREDATLSRDDIRKMFSQAEERVIDVDSQQATLQEEVISFVVEMMKQDEDYVLVEAELEGLVVKAAEALDDVAPRHVGGFIGSIRTQLMSKASDTAMKVLLDELDELLRKRKNVRQILRRHYRKDFKTKKLEEHKSQLKVSTSKVAGTHGRGRLPAAVREEQAKEAGNLTDTIESSNKAVTQALDRIDDESGPDDEDEQAEGDVDVDTLLGAGVEIVDYSRAEPSEWANLPEEVTLEIDRGDAPGDDNARLKFFKRFTALSSIKTGNLKCVLCALDSTIGGVKKAEKYTLWKLNQHLKSSFHSAREELVRSFEAEMVGLTELNCPHCEIAGVFETLYTTQHFLEHAEEAHPFLLEPAL